MLMLLEVGSESGDIQSGEDVYSPLIYESPLTGQENKQVLYYNTHLK